MEEGVSGAIGELDKAETFVVVEPLDDPSNRCTRRGFSERPGVLRPLSETTRLWTIGVGIGVEVATPRLTKILVSHLDPTG